MEYDLSQENDRQIAFNQLNHLLNNERLVRIEEIKPTRTNLQNAALHLFFNIISDELNNMGLEFEYRGIKHVFRLFAQQPIEQYYNTRYTWFIVKNFIWRPIQKTLFNIESTTKINTQQINEISDILIKFFGEKGIRLSFPNLQSKLNELDKNNN